MKNKIKKGSFLYSVLTISSGTVLSQVIGILLSPVITRLYSPEDMGVLASYVAITSVLGVISAGCYDNAIVLPTTPKETNATVFTGLIVTIAMGLLVTVVCFSFGTSLTELLQLQGVSKNWFYMIGVFVSLTGLDLVFNKLAIRNQHYKVLASTQITQQISTNLIKIIIGFFSKMSSGLFWGTLVGQVLRVIRLFFAEIVQLIDSHYKVSWKDIKSSFVRYRKFPLISSWSTLLNSSSLQLPVILFNSFFSSAVAGSYSLSHKILSLPVSLLGTSVGNVFLERIAKEKDNTTELAKLTLNTYKKLLLLGSLILSFVTFYGDLLFPLVFGGEWHEAGQYAQWMSIWIVFSLCYSPISTIYFIKEKQGENLIFQIILFFSRFSIVFVSFFSSNINIILPIYCIISTSVYFLGALRLFQILKVKFLVVFKVFFSNFIVIFFVQFFIAVLVRKVIMM